MIESFGSVGQRRQRQQGDRARQRHRRGAQLHRSFGIFTSLVALLGFSLLQGKTTHVVDDINEVTVQVVNLVTSHRAQMQPSGVTFLAASTLARSI